MLQEDDKKERRTNITKIEITIPHECDVGVGRCGGVKGIVFGEIVGEDTL